MSHFIRPNYGHGCFADLPAALRFFLTGQDRPPVLDALPAAFVQQYDAVICVLADAFGWRFFEQFAEHDPFLQRIANEGVVQKWTAQFPSTTSAHATCIHTGLPPSQSGVYEWQYYEPALDRIIEPLTFAVSGEKRESLTALGVAPAQLYPPNTLYQSFQQQGITSRIYQHRDIAHSTYTDWIGRGATMCPFLTLAEGLVNLRRDLAQSTTPAYSFLYWDKIDAIGHLYGPDSLQMEQEIANFLFCMERALMQPLRKAGNKNGNKGGKRTLLIVTADHGQVETDPKTAIYLNRDSRLQGVERYLRTNRQGAYLVPAGSPRDFFLYVHDHLLDEAAHFLTTRLAGVAEVRKTHQMLDQGYFGPLPATSQFLGRLGNLVSGS